MSGCGRSGLERGGPDLAGVQVGEIGAMLFGEEHAYF
jgi:hypothetical protein